MTLKELSQLRHLKHEIELDTQRLQRLREDAQSVSSPNLSGLPSGGVSGSRTERYIAEISELETIISEKRERCRREQKRLERYIAAIPDSFTRQIFILRFVKGLSWRQCAGRLGGGNDEKNISLICYRYLLKTQNDENDE